MNKSFTVRQIRSQYGYLLAMPTTINFYYVESSDIALNKAVAQSGLDASLLEVVENDVQPVTPESEIYEQFNVTASQLDRTTRLVNGTTGEVYYRVSSQTTADTEYEVRAHVGGHKLTCTCQAGNPQRDRFGMPLGPIVPCWHKRAARAAAYEYRQQENLQARREAEEAARRLNAPLNGNRGFSMMRSDLSAPVAKTPAQKSAPVSMRGYDIRIERIGGPGWMNEKDHGLAPAGELPAEWTRICADPTVLHAVIFPSNQRLWTAAKRRLLAEYRPEVVTA